MKTMHNNKSREKHHNTLTKTKQHHANAQQKDTIISQIKAKTEDHGNAQQEEHDEKVLTHE